MAVTPEDRQLAIDVFTEVLVGQGMDEERAEEFSTMVTDKAIAEQES
jgi:hypothetical protein